MCYSGVWLKKHLRPRKGYSSLESYHTAAIAQLGERQTEDENIVMFLRTAIGIFDENNVLFLKSVLI